MGRRSATETITALMRAFMRQSTWTQAELARALEISSKSVRERLLEMERAGVPLERSEEPPHVYWSVPRGWIAGALTFSDVQAVSLVRLLARVAPTSERDELLAHIATRLPSASRPHGRSSPVVPAEVGAEAYLPLAEEAALKKCAFRVQYFSASSGALRWRDISPVRVFVSPPARTLAVCHESGTLKWFRLANIVAARLAPESEFRAADPDLVERHLAGSIGGFSSDEPAVECRFVVTGADARWVSANLPSGLRGEMSGSDLRVSCVTAAILPLARFVVGLGAAASVETPELAEAVRSLANGALLNLRPPRKVRPIRARQRAS